jgi:hypothetical protein
MTLPLPFALRLGGFVFAVVFEGLTYRPSYFAAVDFGPGVGPATQETPVRRRLAPQSAKRGLLRL